MKLSRTIVSVCGKCATSIHRGQLAGWSHRLQAFIHWRCPGSRKGPAAREEAA